MDALTTIMLWTLLAALVVTVVVAGGVLDAALAAWKKRKEPPPQAVAEETPVEEPVPWSEMESRELRDLTWLEYKREWFGEWDYPEPEDKDE